MLVLGVKKPAVILHRHRDFREAIGVQGPERGLNVGNQITLPDGSLLTAFCLCLGDRYVGDAMKTGKASLR